MADQRGTERQGTDPAWGTSPDFENFFESVPVPLHVVAADGTIQRANKAELDLLGYSQAEYLGRNIAEFHADRPTIDAVLDRLRQGHTIERAPARLRAKDGSIRHVEISSNGHFIDGQFAYTRCCTVDVTHARRAEERQHLLQNILGALPVAIYTTDAGGRITYYNEAAAELAGRQPAAGEMWCVTWRLYEPDGTPLPHDRCPMAVALKEGRAVRGAEAIAERPDGTRRRFAPFPTPLFDGQGTLIGGVNMLLDITERYETDIALARLAAIVTSSEDAIISKKLDSTITSWNAGATRIFGYEAEEMIGQPIYRLIPLELHGEEREVIAKLARGERIEHYETVRVAKDGRRIDVSLTVSPIRDRRGKIVGASKVSRDITERKRAEETQRLLVGELSHRIKNNLATVQSIAKQTLRNSKRPEDFVRSFEGRLQALAAAHSMLSDTRWQGAELRSLIDKILLTPEDDSRVTATGPQVVLGSQATLHMSMTIHELATNARKYGALSRPDGRLSINWLLESDGQEALRLTWTETGSATMKPGKPGFGAKLIQSLMQSNGGEAKMSYEAQGVAWQIRMVLPEPMVHRFPGAAPHPTLAGLVIREPQHILKGRRALVVEDEPIVLLELEQILSDAGIEVVASAATLSGALAAARDHSFDIALLDANLGGRPVDEVAAQLARQHIPFLFLSGYMRESLPEAFRDRTLVSKPFTSQQVLDAISALLSPHGSNVLRLPASLD